MKVTIVGGGNIGSAIALGRAESGILPASDITVTDKFQGSLDRIHQKNDQIQLTLHNEEGVPGADLVIMAVKPWLADDVLKEVAPHMDYKKQMLASIVAGLKIDEIKKIVDRGDGETPVIFRIMANIGISQRKSVNSISGSADAKPEQIETMKSLFGTLGKTFYIPEDLQVAATSLTSCGIAFALKYLSDAMSGGVMVGFSQQEAREMVMQTMEGALAVLNANGTMPDDEIKLVTTPGGVTLRGLDAMEKANFTKAVQAGILKSR